MRSKKVALYAIFDSLNQIIRSVLSIYVRRIFIISLGDELMGLNGLFSSVLSFLSLAELGFGSVVAVCLYQSIAEDNKKNISAYMHMLKKVYWVMGIFILIGGWAFFPIMRTMINGTYTKNVVIVGYGLHLLATATSYFCSYRSTLLHANQEGYVISRINLLLYTVFLSAQIIVLTYWKNYYGFLVCTILQNLISGVWITSYVNKKYCYLVEKEYRVSLPNEEKTKFMKKFKAMIVYKISNYLIQGADSMIISVLLGTVVVGYYSNYNLIVNMCWAIFGSVVVGSVAGIGNMIYTEKDKVKETLFRLLLIQQFIFCISATGIFQISSLFVNTFFSEKSILSTGFVAILSFYYYCRGIIHPLEAVRMGAGIYENDKWKQLALAMLNVIVSILGCVCWGIEGVVLGTFLCYFIRGIWLTPKQVFGNIIDIEWKNQYFATLLFHAGLSILINIALYWGLKNIQITNLLLELLIKGIICVFFSLFINMIVYCKTEEYRYMYITIKNYLIRKKH